MTDAQAAETVNLETAAPSIQPADTDVEEKPVDLDGGWSFSGTEHPHPSVRELNEFEKSEVDTSVVPEILRQTYNYSPHEHDEESDLNGEFTRMRAIIARISAEAKKHEAALKTIREQFESIRNLLGATAGDH